MAESKVAQKMVTNIAQPPNDDAIYMICDRQLLSTYYYKLLKKKQAADSSKEMNQIKWQIVALTFCCIIKITGTVFLWRPQRSGIGNYNIKMEIKNDQKLKKTVY